MVNNAELEARAVMASLCSCFLSSEQRIKVFFACLKGVSSLFHACWMAFVSKANIYTYITKGREIK